MYKLFFLFLPIALFTSCEKEINIDLNTSNPKFIIEANLSDAVGDSTLVIVSKTLNFNETIAYPKVSDALVTITDNDTAIHTLSLIKPGVYFIPNFVGFTGHRYTLNVLIDTQLFSSSSIMPSRIVLDSITLLNSPGGSGGGPPGAKSNVVLTPYFMDQKDVVNYYQIAASRNDTLLYNIEMRDDLIFDGLINQRPMRVEASKNDSVLLDLQCVNKSAYNYFLGLANNLGQFSATPSNPPTTFNNGALGYFKVYSSSKRIYVVP